jgi:hypothetical protein
MDYLQSMRLNDLTVVAAAVLVADVVGVIRLLME